MKIILAAVLLLVPALANSTTPASILHSGVHEAYEIINDLTAVGQSGYSSSVAATATQGVANQSVCGSAIGNQGAALISQSASLQSTYQVNATCTPLNPTVTYPILGEADNAYSVAGYDQALYSDLITNQFIYTIPACGTLAAGDYPPVVMVTQLQHGSPASGGSGQCGYSNGIEFSIPITTGDTSCGYSTCWTPINDATGSIPNFYASDTSEAMEAVLALIKNTHPSWNWQDIKSVLRITASNWSTGWAQNNSGALGYGDISLAANTYSGTIYLQPPGLSLQNSGCTRGHICLTLYPFASTRRNHEVLVLYPTSSSWPVIATGCSGVCNELTTANFPAGYTFICGNATTACGTTVNSTQVVNLSPAGLPVGNYNVVALTTDSLGNYSRVESFQPFAVSLVGTFCN